MLEGKTVNLRIAEKEDLSLAAEWLNKLDYFGEYNPLMQISKAELQKMYENLSPEERWFFIEKKDGSKVGSISHTSGKGTGDRLCYTVK